LILVIQEIEITMLCQTRLNQFMKIETLCNSIKLGLKAYLCLEINFTIIMGLKKF